MDEFPGVTGEDMVVLMREMLDSYYELGLWFLDRYIDIIEWFLRNYNELGHALVQMASPIIWRG